MEKTVAIYRFHEAGHVTATVGTKKGPIAGPVFYWKIEGKLLRITEKPNASVYQELEAVSFDGTVLTARLKSGDLLKYKVSKDGM